MIFHPTGSAPTTEADLEQMRAAMDRFNTDDEVRFAFDAPALPHMLNTLVAAGRKFYLVHLPGRGGWVLRRRRPTGVYGGVTLNPADAGAAP